MQKVSGLTEWVDDMIDISVKMQKSLREAVNILSDFTQKLYYMEEKIVRLRITVMNLQWKSQPGLRKFKNCNNKNLQINNNTKNAQIKKISNERLSFFIINERLNLHLGR